jgi:hypothetical protein
MFEICLHNKMKEMAERFGHFNILCSKQASKQASKVNAKGIEKTPADPTGFGEVGILRINDLCLLA